MSEILNYDRNKGIKWEYSITKNEGDGLKGYGYHLTIMKDGKVVSEQGAFGGIAQAEDTLHRYIDSYYGQEYCSECGRPY